MKISAVIPTRGDVDLAAIIERLQKYSEITEIIVKIGDTTLNRYRGIRQAVNTPIQSGAGGIIKEAMRQLHPLVVQWREEYGVVVRSLLQVHDELIFEVEDEWIPVVAEQFHDVMVNAVELSVPVKVDVEVGLNWKELEAYELS